MRVDENKIDKGNTISTLDEITEQYESVDILHGKLSISDLLEVRITLIDSNSEVIHTSDNSEKIIGYTSDDFKLLDTYGYIHPDDRAKVKSKFKVFNEKGRSEDVLYRIFRPSGEMCWIRGFAKQLIDKEKKVPKGIILFEFDLTKDFGAIQQKPVDEESQYKLFLETIKVPILFMKNNAMVWATQNWCKFFGYKLDEIRNQSVDILFTSQEDYAQYLLECNQKLKSESQLTYHTNLIIKGEKTSKIDIHVYTLEKNSLAKGILLFFLDVSDIEELLYIKDKLIDYYRSIVNNSDAAVIRIENQKIVWKNKATETIFQYKENELNDKDVSILFQTKDACKKLFSEINKKIINKKNLVGEVHCIRKDRYPITLALRVIPISYQKTNEFFLYLEPISEIRQLANQLRDEKSELEYYSDLLFHDVKNYCQNALSQIDLSLMKLDESPEEAKHKQRKSQIEILRIAELINNMDKFFKVKRQGYELQSYDIYIAVEKSKTKITSKFDHRTININHNLTPQNYLTTGNELLEDVFLNILDNIIMLDNNPEVNIDLVIEPSDEKDDYWSINFQSLISLKGMDITKYLGIKDAKVESSVYGSGFGLTLAKSIIESLNGEMRYSEAKSTSEKSAIIIDIPKYQSDD